MPQVTIRANAELVASDFVGAMFGQNLANINLYLGKSPNVSPTNFDSFVGPNGTFTWLGTDGPLYGVTDPGAEGTINFLINGGGGFNVTPGSQLVVNRYETVPLYSQATLLPAATTITILDSVDVSAYSTLYVQVNTIASLAAANATGVCSQLVTRWFTASGLLLGDDAPYYSDNGYLNYRIPIRGALVSVYIVKVAGTSPTLNVEIFASTNSETRRYEHKYANLARTSGWSGGVAYTNAYTALAALVSGTANGTSFVYIDSYAGPAYIGITTGGISGYHELVLMPTGAILHAPLLSAGASTQFLLLLPEMPLRVQIELGGAGNLTTSQKLIWQE